MQYSFDTKNGVAFNPYFWGCLRVLYSRIFCICHRKLGHLVSWEYRLPVLKFGTVLGKLEHLYILLYPKVTTTLRPSETTDSGSKKANHILILSLELGLCICMCLCAISNNISCLVLNTYFSSHINCITIFETAGRKTVLMFSV